MWRLQEALPVDTRNQTDSEVSTDVDGLIGAVAQPLGRAESTNLAQSRVGSDAFAHAPATAPLLRRFGPKEIYSRRLLSNIQAGDDLERGEIDYFYRAWF